MSHSLGGVMSSNTNKKDAIAKQNTKNLMLAIMLISIIIVISTILFIFPHSTTDIDAEIPDIEEQEIDDTISPDNINQAVTLEIRRIHKKGIESLIRKIGNSWKNYPTFYCKALIDTVEWRSLETNSWDTGYVDWYANRFVEDELESIKITLQIIEIKDGLLRTTEHTIDEFDLTYDFRTGRWNGDDYFNDSDGYGHLNGNEYEIWFKILQTEEDGDNIPYWWENNELNTDPTIDDSTLDPDNDSIPTSWEWEWGYDPYTYENHSHLDPDRDGLSNIEEYQQEKWLANPFHKEIYLEVDMMEKGPSIFSLEHIFWKESQWMMMDIFTPKDITVHIDDGWSSASSIGGGEILPYYEDYISPISGGLSTFYTYNFADERKGVFRYVVIHESGGWCFPQRNTLRPDVLSIPCNREYYRNVYFPPAINERLKILAMAIAVTHELGHSLNLNPDYCQGIDNASQVGRNNLPPIQKLQEKINARNYWDTYESVMNYAKFGNYILDFSDGSHGMRDSNDWEQIDLTFFQHPIDEEYGIGDE